MRWHGLPRPEGMGGKGEKPPACLAATRMGIRTPFKAAAFAEFQPTQPVVGAEPGSTLSPTRSRRS